MSKWYLVKLRYQKEQIVSSRGGDMVKLKTVTEQYLVDAVSHTEAEAIINREMASNTPDFSVFYIHPQRIADVCLVGDNGENWYNCKVEFQMEDDKGREKKIRNTMYINATDEGSALNSLKEQLKSIMVPYEVVFVSKTKVLDVYFYEKQAA